jgi:hypothetical protein
MTNIDAILYSYKNKNLKAVVDALLDNTSSDIFVHVFDQHPLDRSSMFNDPRISYEHIFWDTIQSPCERKGNIVNISTADYLLQLSDDCVVSKNWDQALIAFVSGEQRIVSGNKKIKLDTSDKFFLKAEGLPSASFELSGYVDRNFIFASTKIWNSIRYPYYLKYNGEEEMMSLDFFRTGKNIYSAPNNLYTDLGLRTLDNLYVPFSKDHNYNNVVEALTITDPQEKYQFQKSLVEFLEFHGIEQLDLKKLPYQTNDVDYNPYGLKFQDIDARKFISNTKAIY